MKIVDERKDVIMERVFDNGIVIYPQLEQDAPELSTFLAACIRVRFDAPEPTIEVNVSFRGAMSIEAVEAWRAAFDKAIEIAKGGDV